MRKTREDGLIPFEEHFGMRGTFAREAWGKHARQVSASFRRTSLRSVQPSVGEVEGVLIPFEEWTLEDPLARDKASKGRDGKRKKDEVEKAWNVDRI